MPEKPPSAPLVRLAELKIDPAQIDAYLEVLNEEIEASLANEPGVLMLYALRLRDDPSEVRLVEIYVDQAAYEAHLQSPHFLNYKRTVEGMVLSLTLRETDPIRLGARAELI